MRLPLVEAALIEWIKDKLSNHVRLSGDIIMEKAHEICDIKGIPVGSRIEFSRGWLDGFKKRHGLHQVTFHGERASAPVQNIDSETARLRPILDKFAPCDRYNVDETAFYFQRPPQKAIGIIDSGGVKDSKTRLTYVLCANQDSSHKLPPVIIGRVERPKCFDRDVRAAGYW